MSSQGSQWIHNFLYSKMSAYLNYKCHLILLREIMFACTTSFVNVLLGWFSWKIENIMQVHIFFFYGQYFPDNHTRREILQMTTPCLNKDTGCDWFGEVRSAEVRVKRLLLIPCSRKWYDKLSCLICSLVACVWLFYFLKSNNIMV